MATKTFDELIAGATVIKNNELPESNTHTLVGGQLLEMANKHKESDQQSDVINVTTKFPLAAGSYYTSSTARSAVTAEYRKLGKKLLYQTDATTWVEEKFIGSAITDAIWNADANWQGVASKNDVIQLGADLNQKIGGGKFKANTNLLSYAKYDGYIKIDGTFVLTGDTAYYSIFPAVPVQAGVEYTYSGLVTDTIVGAVVFLDINNNVTGYLSKTTDNLTTGTIVAPDNSTYAVICGKSSSNISFIASSDFNIDSIYNIMYKSTDYLRNELYNQGLSEKCNLNISKTTSNIIFAIKSFRYYLTDNLIGSDIFELAHIGWYSSNNNVYVQIFKNGTYYKDCIIGTSPSQPTGIKEYHYQDADQALHIIIDFGIIIGFKTLYGCTIVPFCKSTLPNGFGDTAKQSDIIALQSNIASLQSTLYPYAIEQRNILNDISDTNFNPVLKQSFTYTTEALQNENEKYYRKLILTSITVQYNWAYYYLKTFGTLSPGKYVAFIKLKSSNPGSSCKLVVMSNSAANIASKNITTTNKYDLYAVDFTLTTSSTVAVGIGSNDNAGLAIGDEFGLSVIGIANSKGSLNFSDDIYTLEDLKYLVNSNQISTVDKRFTSTDPLGLVKDSQTLASIFHDWGFIGDSLNSGELQWNDGTWHYVDCYEHSWGQRLCALIGNAKGTNFSVGGLTTTTWLSKYWSNLESGFTLDGSTSIFTTDKKKAYTIALGTNDAGASIAIGGFDTDVNLTDFTQNASTFIGNYAGIIQRIKSVQPSAKIFVITIPDMWSSLAETNGYNNAIRLMTSKFNNVYLIDLYAYITDNAGFRNMYKMGGHMTTQGYQYIAFAISTYIDYIIRNNYDSFSKVALIGNQTWDNGNL